MFKTFTLQSISHHQQNLHSGVIYWHITDESNHSRKVQATTELSDQGFIKIVKARNKREMPLVELLSQYGEGDTFEIDFSLYNQTFGYKPRDVFPQAEKTLPSSNKWLDGLRNLFQVPFRSH